MLPLWIKFFISWSLCCFSLCSSVVFSLQCTNSIYNLESWLMKPGCIQIRHILKRCSMWLYLGSSLLRSVDICNMCVCVCVYQIFIFFYILFLAKFRAPWCLLYLSAMKVDIWDLRSAEKFAQLPSNIPSSSSNVSNKDRGLFMLFMIFELRFWKYHLLGKFLLLRLNSILICMQFFYHLSTLCVAHCIFTSATNRQAPTIIDVGIYFWNYIMY